MALKRLILLCIFLLSTNTYADQHTLFPINSGTTEAAVEFLKSHTKIAYWCENCDDVSPKYASAISVSKRVDTRYKQEEVYVNGKSIDLAYTYYQGKNGYYYNLAHHLGLQTTGVQNRFSPDDFQKPDRRISTELNANKKNPSLESSNGLGQKDKKAPLAK